MNTKGLQKSIPYDTYCDWDGLIPLIGKWPVADTLTYYGHGHEEVARLPNEKIADLNPILFALGEVWHSRKSSKNVLRWIYPPNSTPCENRSNRRPKPILLIIQSGLHPHPGPATENTHTNKGWVSKHRLRAKNPNM